MRAMLLLVLGVVATGCARQREEAPRELDELAHLVFSEYEQPELVGVATELAGWLAEEGDGEEAWDGLLLTNLTEAEVADTDYPPEMDLSVHVGLANAAVSPFSVLDHAALIAASDQTWTDPGSFEQYERTVLEGEPSAFSEGRGVLRTRNEIVKSGAFGVTIPYTLRKDYRWVDLEDGSRAIAARAWLEETGCSDNGKNCVLQSWGVELFHDAAPSETRRLYAVWIEVRTEADGLLSDDGKIALMAKGNQDILEGTDEELAARAE